MKKDEEGVICSTHEEIRGIITGFRGNLKERGHFRELCGDVKIILKRSVEGLN
jgi:hypothetical protein